jgi:hypothetical protein
MSSQPSKPRTSNLVFKLLAGPLVVIAALLGTGFAKWCRTSCCVETPTTVATAPGKTSLKLPADLCKDWPKPDVVLLLSAQEHGYLFPCGCSKPQKGGLERRYNLIQILNDRGWEVVAVDVGDIPQAEAPVKLPNIQGELKYITSMKALKAMNYTAVGIGEYEAKMPLNVPLDWYAVSPLKESLPRILAANLTNRDDEYPTAVDAWKLADKQPAGIKIGVTSIVGPIVAEKKIKDPTPKFGDGAKALEAVLKSMDKEKIDLRLLLYQGYATLQNKPDQPPEAIACAKAFPQFQVMLCLSEEDDPEMDEERSWVDQGKDKPKTLLARLGHKGKYVGLVGIYKNAKPRYQVVELSEDFLTPEAEVAKHPIVNLMEDYTLELKNGKYLQKYGQTKHPLQVDLPDVVPEYVGSEACKNCHEWAYSVWKKSKHSHAYQTLVDAKHPSNRQYDAECIVCHTVGFGYQTGFKDADATPKLKNVGCESCHGPGGAHVKDHNNEDLAAKLNPWKEAKDETPKQKEKRLFKMDLMCQRCHDPENDVHWTNGGLQRKWPIVKHYDEDAK